MAADLLRTDIMIAIGVEAQHTDMVGISDCRHGHPLAGGTLQQGIDCRLGDDGTKAASAVHVEKSGSAPGVIALGQGIGNPAGYARDDARQTQQAVRGNAPHFRIEQQIALQLRIAVRNASLGKDAVNDAGGLLEINRGHDGLSGRQS